MGLKVGHVCIALGVLTLAGCATQPSPLTFEVCPRTPRNAARWATYDRAYDKAMQIRGGPDRQTWNHTADGSRAYLYEWWPHTWRGPGGGRVELYVGRDGRAILYRAGLIPVELNPGAARSFEAAVIAAGFPDFARPVDDALVLCMNPDPRFAVAIGGQRAEVKGCHRAESVDNAIQELLKLADVPRSAAEPQMPQCPLPAMTGPYPTAQEMREMLDGVSREKPEP